MKQTKPTPELLDFEIYDLGLEAALQKYNLTLEAAEKILFKTPIKPNKERKSNKCYILPELSEAKLQPLYKAIEANYNYLFNLFKGKADLNIITKHSNNKEDSFHSALLKLFEDSSEINEDKTLSYIKHSLFYSKLSEERDLFRDKTEFVNIDNFQNFL